MAQIEAKAQRGDIEPLAHAGGHAAQSVHHLGRRLGRVGVGAIPEVRPTGQTHQARGPRRIELPSKS